MTLNAVTAKGPAPNVAFSLFDSPALLLRSANRQDNVQVRALDVRDPKPGSDRILNRIPVHLRAAKPRTERHEVECKTEHGIATANMLKHEQRSSGPQHPV